ncbi:bromodomain-containing protein [Vairimorpha necatrix]|uniref:Bromodomain-containing protein n=1 Tax=Vairimorpha necatrix TaxID=6039 RepID=A0AAX4JFB3_9MICR
MEQDQALLDYQMKYCSTILQKLKRNPSAFPFLEPVDPVKYGIPDYPLKVKFPMDISTIKKKLDTKMYSSPSSFNSDIKLMFNNCYIYNHPDSEVYIMGKNLEQNYDLLFNELPVEICKKRKRPEINLERSKRIIRSGDTINIDEYEFCIDLINNILQNKYKTFTWPFLEPVNSNLLPQYYEIIKNPMDLKTIKDKLDNKMYQNIDEFTNDLKLIVDNCHKFNDSGSEVYRCGSELNELINLLLSKYEPKDIKGRILELKKKISQYTKECKMLENKLKDKNDSTVVLKNYSLNERIELGNRILNLSKGHTDSVAKIIQKYSAGEYVENNEIEVDLRILPDNVYEEIDRYISNVEMGIEEKQE